MEVQASPQLEVVVNSPDRLIWEGKAYSVSSENSTGPFDVLPEHANFVTMIEKKPITIRTGLKEEVFQYDNAVLSVKDNVLTVYAEI